jgi:hypothetical protein
MESSTSSQASALQWFQLIFFALSTQVVFFNLFKHGKAGVLGWFFILQLCLMRTAGNAILKAAKDPSLIEIGNIIVGASLSALFFGFFGIWHEA